MSADTPRKVMVPRRRERGSDPLHPFYELDIWLVNSDPPIWRSVIVPAVASLRHLHAIIQIVMGWDDDHEHQFETKSRRRFEADPFDFNEIGFGGSFRGPEDEARVLLRDLFDELKDPITYTYDFGDNWVHGIKLIRTHADVSAFDQLPICTAGERAGPPEDCGGIWAYQESLASLKECDSDDDWCDESFEEDFDPERFERDSANAELRRMTNRIAERLKRAVRGEGTGQTSSFKKRKRKSR